MVVVVAVGEAEVVVTRAVAEVEAIAAAAAVVVSTEEGVAIEVVAGPRIQEEGESECPRGEEHVSHPWEDSAPQWDSTPSIALQR